MANVTATITYYGYPRGNDNSQRMQTRWGTIALSPTNGTYPAGGIALTWNASGTMTIPFPATAPSSTGTIMPVDVDVKSVSATDGPGGVGSGPSGYIYLWNNVNGNLHIFQSLNGASGASGPLVEIGGNVPWGVFTDTIQFKAVFARE